MNALAGIGGSLFPGQYLVAALDARTLRLDPHDETRRRRLEAWWIGALASCGPATGLRALFDRVAAPLFGALGFRVEDADFSRTQARARLRSPGDRIVGLLLRPWASARSLTWRDASETARGAGAEWCFVLAPPYVSLVDSRGHAVRRSVDFTLPDVLGPDSFCRFWALARARAFDPPSALDAHLAAAAEFQDHVRTDLQTGVLDAITALGRVVGGPGAFDEAQTLVYRLLFLLFAESRQLVPLGHPVYARAYAIGALGRAALAPEPPRGLWEGLAAVTRLSRIGCRVDDLEVRPFNGRLFARSSAPALEAGPRRPARSRRSDERDVALQRALIALGTRKGRGGRESISYADLGVEQLGAVYERILDVGDPGDERLARPSAARAHSERRKQTGTFYTPQPLAEFVVRRTLAPLVHGLSPDRVLSLRVVDPAMGSGAFLVAACRYLAAAYERALVEHGQCGDADVGEDERANIRRLVCERCLAGVDDNPTAVHLARLSLWLTSLARDKPLGFLDHRLRVGNSLVGASPADLTRAPAGRARTSNVPALPLFDAAGLETSMRLATGPLRELALRRDDSVEDVRAKETTWSRLTGETSPLEPWRRASDLWCARWFGDRPIDPRELRAALDALLKGDATLAAGTLARRLAQARAAATAHRFFHWPLEFADVFYDQTGQPRADAGFDAVIGNPPWEMLRKDGPHPARGTPRSAAPDHRSLVRFIRESGLYPGCDRGHVNLYQPFVERALALVRRGGRVGLVVPWGLAADDGAVRLRHELLERGGLDTVVGLDNARGLFPIHRGLRFLVIVAAPGAPARRIRAKFGVTSAAALDDLPGHDDPAADSGGRAYAVSLSPERLRRVGGPARRIPDARHAADLSLLEHLAGCGPPLGDATGWAVRFGRELNATEDRSAFGADGLPVIEGKHLSPFGVDVSGAPLRIERRAAERLLPDGRFDRARLAYRDVSGVANRLSLIAAVVPGGVVTTHTVFCLRSSVTADHQHFLCGLFNSYVLNAVVRLLMGGHVTTSLVEGLPVPRWTGSRTERRIARIARAIARRPGVGRLHAALQATVAHYYRLDDGGFAHVLRGFPLVDAGARDSARQAFLCYSPRRCRTTASPST